MTPASFVRAVVAILAIGPLCATSRRSRLASRHPSQHRDCLTPTQHRFLSLYTQDGNIAKRPVVDISLLIPSVGSEAPCLVQLLNSVARGSTLPAETIVTVSSVTVKERCFLLAVEKMFQLRLPGLRIVQRTTTHSQDSNRDLAFLLSSRDIVSAFDADDVMHPQRLEFVSRAFEQYPRLDCLLHNYENFHGGLPAAKLYNSRAVSVMDGEFYDTVRRGYRAFRQQHGPGSVMWCCDEFGTEFYFLSANGWPTMRRHVWQAVPQLPGNKSHGEDSAQITEIALAGFNIGASPLVLGYYRQAVGRHKQCSLWQQLTLAGRSRGRGGDGKT